VVAAHRDDHIGEIGEHLRAAFHARSVRAPYGAARSLLRNSYKAR
jgi:hypothetical protein